MKIYFKSFVRAKLLSLTLFLILLCLCLFGTYTVFAQENYSSSELQELVGPVALYPDDLLANILTAATVPDQISKAAAYLKQKGGKVTSMPDTDWDPAVKSLLFFPDVLNMMNTNTQWTQALGYAVSIQKNDVMKAIQSYRSSAYSAGNLQTTPQQTVTTSGSGGASVIEIAPTNPQVVYVPEYNYQEAMYPYSGVAPLLGFGAGWAVGSWFGYRTFDWAHNNIMVNANNYRAFNYRQGQRYYNYNNFQNRGYANANVWRPDRNAPRPTRPAVSGGVPRVTNPIARRGTGVSSTRPGGSTIPMARPSTTRPSVTSRPSMTTTNRPSMSTTNRPSFTSRPPMPTTRPTTPFSGSTVSPNRSSLGSSNRASGFSPSYRSSNNAFSNINRGMSTISSSNRGSFSRGSMGGSARSGGFSGSRGGGMRGGGGRRR